MELRWQALDDRRPPRLEPAEVQLHLVPRTAAARWRDRLLASALECAPADLRYAREEHGRPYLDAADAPAFNLAHSDAYALLALARGTEVGVDLEAPRTVARREQLLARFFVDGERAAIAAAHDPERLLLHAWAGKEAVVKAIGRGIAYGLARVELALDEHGVAGLRALDGPAGARGPWQVGSFELPDRYLGALAWRGAPRPVRAFLLTAR
jgi:4'-phosphopantetheinyl transferase